MAEKTLALPLSGAEVKQAILDRISQALDSDCFLHDASAYDYFYGTAEIRLTLHDAGREEDVNVGVVSRHGELSEPLTEGKAEIKFEQAPPNQVRVETGQPVPTDTGKKIKYSRKVAEKAS